MSRGRGFTAERKIQKSGDPLTTRLTMTADSKLLTTIFRNQGVCSSLALVGCAILWAIILPINRWISLQHEVQIDCSMPAHCKLAVIRRYIESPAGH
jgi:hypothetical protein